MGLEDFFLTRKAIGLDFKSIALLRKNLIPRSVRRRLMSKSLGNLKHSSLFLLSIIIISWGV